MNTNPNNPNDALDQATSQRLGQLRTMPVEMSRLTRAIQQQIPRPEAVTARQRRWWLRPASAIAASVGLIGCIIVLVIASSAGPVLASAESLAALHQNATLTAMPMGTMSSACDWLASQLPDQPKLPEISTENVPACCVGHIGRKPLGCVVMEVDKMPVTLAIAKAGEFKTAEGASIDRNGVRYGMQSSGGVNIITFARNGHWFALIGSVSAERLMDFAQTLKL